MNDCQDCRDCDRCNGGRGPRGFRGPRGYEGPLGLDGEQGPKGEQGAQGSRGPRGFEGNKGELGPIGPKGDPGTQGLRGPQGIEGKKGKKGEPGPTGPKGDTGEKGERGPAGKFESAYGYAYSNYGTSESGAVNFIIAGPLRDVEITKSGLKVLKSGIYQIDYKVLLESKAITCSPSSFQLVINDKIKIPSSETESTTSNTLTSTLLFSLKEGDVINLVADLQEHFSYKLASLLIIQVE